MGYGQCRLELGNSSEVRDGPFNVTLLEHYLAQRVLRVGASGS
jgi:hypothetical protein